MVDKKTDVGVEVSTASTTNGLRLPTFKVGTASMYVLEHFILLLHVVIGLFLLTGMFGRLMNYAADAQVSGFLASLEYETTIGLLAGVVIVFPLLGFFFTRVRSAESTDKKLLEKNWRQVWLNAFLALVFVWGLTAVVGLANELIDALLNAGLDVGGEELWISVARHVFTLVLMVGVWRFFYEGKTSSSAANDRKFMVGFVSLASLLLILTAAFPLADQRNSRIDGLISDDLSEISQTIDEYVADQNRLPSELGDLNLDDSILNRADDYAYEYTRTSASGFSAEYELCAVFKTDTTDDVADDSFGLLDAISGTVPRGFGATDFTRHTSGRDCFDVTSNNFNPFSSGFEDSSAPEIDTFFDSIQ